MENGMISFMPFGTVPIIHYPWRKNGIICPSETFPTLTIDPVDFGNAGIYDVVVTNPCGSATSNAAILDVCAGEAGCFPADLNGDGVIDGLDIQRFVETLLGC